MADAGLSPRDLQTMMRHASIATTEKYYLGVRAVETAERVARQLAAAAGKPEKYLGTPEASEQKKDLQPSP